MRRSTLMETSTNTPSNSPRQNYSDWRHPWNQLTVINLGLVSGLASNSVTLTKGMAIRSLIDNGCGAGGTVALLIILLGVIYPTTVLTGIHLGMRSGSAASTKEDAATQGATKDGMQPLSAWCVVLLIIALVSPNQVVGSSDCSITKETNRGKGLIDANHSTGWILLIMLGCVVINRTVMTRLLLTVATTSVGVVLQTSATTEINVTLAVAAVGTGVVVLALLTLCNDDDARGTATRSSQA